MADRSAKLNLILAGDNRGAIKSVDQIGNEFGKVEGKAKGIGAGIAGAFSVGAVVAGGKKIVDAYEGAAGQVAKFKRLTGESAKDSSALVFAAQQAGVPFEKVAGSATIFATNLEKGKVAAKGIVTKDANGNLLDFNKILDNTADYLHSLPPGFQRTAAARDLFGKGGADMAKILGNGSQALDDQRAKMKALGLEFDENGLKKYGKLVQAQRDVSAGWKGMQVQIGSALAPELTTLFHGITDAEMAFEKLPAPVKTGGVVIAGLAVAVGGAVTALGFLGPAVQRGLGVLGVGGKEAATAAGEVEGLSAATAQLALEEEAATAASIAFNDTIRAGGSIEEASAAATLARTEALTAGTAATAEAEGATIGLAGALGPAAVAAAGLGAAYVLLSGGADQAKKNVDELTDAAKNGGNATELFERKLAATIAGTKGGFNLDISGDEFRDDLNKSGLSVEQLNRIIKGSDRSFKEWKTGLIETDPTLGSFAVQVGDLRQALKDAGVKAKDEKRILGDLGVTTDNTKDKTKGLGDAAKITAAQMQGQYDKAKQLADFEAGQADAATAAFKASQSYASSKADVAAAESALADARNKKDPSAVAAAERDLAAAIETQAENAADLADASDKAAGKTLSASDKASIFRAELDKLHRSTGFWNADLDTLAGRLDVIRVKAKLAADALALAEKERLLVAYDAYHHGVGPANVGGQHVPLANAPEATSSTTTVVGGTVVGGQHKPFSNGPADSARSLGSIIHVDRMYLGGPHGTRELQLAGKKAADKIAHAVRTGATR